jgi:hypothetical protein
MQQDPFGICVGTYCLGVGNSPSKELVQDSHSKTLEHAQVATTSTTVRSG